MKHNISNPDLLSTSPKVSDLRRCLVLQCGKRVQLPNILCPDCYEYLSTGTLQGGLPPWEKLCGLLRRLSNDADLYSRGEQPSWARPVRHDMGG